MLTKVLFTAALCCATSIAEAQTVRVVVGGSPGSTTDLLTRTLADYMQKETGRTFVVENRVGGTGVLALQQVANATPDGTTLFLALSGPLIVRPKLMQEPTYPFGDFSLIGSIGRSEPFFLAISAQIPAKNLKEFVAYAQQHNTSFAQYAASQHVLSLYLATKHRFRNPVAVPYRGQAAQTRDMLAVDGKLHWMFTGSAARDQGKDAIRFIGVADYASNKRLPDVPPLYSSEERGRYPEFWFGLAGPKGMPPQTVSELSALLGRALLDPETREKIERMNFLVEYRSSEEFGRYLKQEDAKWQQIVDYLRAAKAALPSIK